MPWPQRSLQPKSSAFKLEKVHWDLGCAKSIGLCSAEQFSWKLFLTSFGAVYINSQHLTNPEIAENGEIEARMPILTGWCNLQLWGGIWWIGGIAESLPASRTHTSSYGRVGQQGPNCIRERSPYKCSSTLRCTTQSWSTQQCIAFHGQIKVIIQFPSITPVDEVNCILIYHRKSGELKLRVLANVSGGEKVGSLLPLGGTRPPAYCMAGRAVTNSQLAGGEN